MIGTSKRATKQKSFRLPVDINEKLKQCADNLDQDETATLKLAIYMLHKDLFTDCKETYGPKFWFKKIRRNFHEDQMELESSCIGMG